MQYEISGSVLAGQITTTTWAVAPSRTWAWSRAIGGAGRGIGGAGQFASWTRAEAAVARATVPPRRSTLRWSCPGRALGEGSGRSGLGAPWTRAAQLATSAWAVAPSRTWSGPGRSVGLAAASAELASSRRGPGRLSSRRSPGRRQPWPGPRYPPTEAARFLGYEVVVQGERHQARRQRTVNGIIGLRVPQDVVRAKSAAYMRDGKPIHLGARLHDSPYSIVERVPGGVPGRRQLLPACNQPGRTKPSTLGHGNVTRQDACGQAEHQRPAGVQAVQERWSRLSEQRCPV